MWIVLVIFSWLVFFDTVAYGQTGGCSIKLDQAPSLRGIKLGMSLNQVLDLIPGSREDRKVTNVLEAARLMREKQLRRLPVDQDRQLVGILSLAASAPRSRRRASAQAVADRCTTLVE